MSYNVNTIISNTEALLKLRHDETLTTTTPQRLHDCLGTAVMMAINETWTTSKKNRENKRKAYYFSAEYLMGRLVYSNLFNLGILDQVKAALEAKGVDIANMEDIEDAALGNGGLGRLAACFLDSAASTNTPCPATVFVTASVCSSRSLTRTAANVRLLMTGPSMATPGPSAATTTP